MVEKIDKFCEFGLLLGVIGLGISLLSFAPLLVGYLMSGVWDFTVTVNILIVGIVVCVFGILIMIATVVADTLMND